METYFIALLENTFFLFCHLSYISSYFYEFETLTCCYIGEKLLVMCAVAETVKATLSVYSSPSATLQHIDILCNTHLHAVHWLSVHAARVYSVHQSIQVCCWPYQRELFQTKNSLSVQE